MITKTSTTILAFYFFLSVAVAKPVDSQESHLGDLGDSGNRIVRDTFHKYTNRHPLGQCLGTDSLLTGRRVIVTGFGLFAGAKYNVSGTVARSMATPNFWPEKIDLSLAPPNSIERPVNGILKTTDFGAWGANRNLSIDGQDYTLCFLVLDVLWDLAGAIVLYEANLFKPDLILMLGRGYPAVALFESGALNSSATSLSGYSSQGEPHPDNRYHQPWIIRDLPVGQELTMNWESQKLALENREAIERLGYKSEAAPSARPENSYICNNLSFTVLYGTKNSVTELAGNLLPIRTEGLTSTRVGFFHLPAVDYHHPKLESYAAGIFGWSQIVARTIKLSLD